MTFCVEKFKGLLVAATFSMLIEYLMGLSDCVVVGNLLGERALAAVNLLQSPMNFVSFFANLLGTGTAICFSLEVGRFNAQRANEFFSQGFWGAISVGLLLVTLFIFGRTAFFAVLGADAETTALANAYWIWFTPCALLELVAVLLSSTCYADGDGRLCICSYAVQLLGNVGLSIVLTKAMGIEGCALGTTLGDLGAVLTLSCHFFRKSNTLRITRHYRLGDLFGIMKISFGDASTRLCWAALFFILNKCVIRLGGSDALPVAGVVVALLGFSEAFNGVPTAAQPLVGVYAGEKNTTGVRTVMRAALKVSLAEGLAVTLFLLAFPGALIRLFGIDEPALIPAATTAVRLTALSMIGWSVASLFNSYYLFIARETLACALTFLANFALPAALFLLGGALFGLTGGWAALAAAPHAALLSFALFLLARYGRARFPLLLSRTREKLIHVFNLRLEEEAVCSVSKAVGVVLRAARVAPSTVARVALLVEETLMAVRDRNGTRRVIAEATLDLNPPDAAEKSSREKPSVQLVLRDDGEIFDITDADAAIGSLRTYLVASLMATQRTRCNLTTTGFNRNVFRF